MKEKEEEKVFPKVRLSWYPGHMAKTKRQIIEDLKLIDIVIEILDARIPLSSRNPDIETITNKKKKIIILNKSDLAEENQNVSWINYYKNKNISAIAVDSNTGKGIEKVEKEIEKLMEEELIKNSNKGRIGKKIKVMVLGIPNVGKSSFINRISKRATANVANKPGVTRQKQWVRINEKIELLDTPGILWPKLGNEKTSLNLAFTGTIKETILNNTEIAYNLIKYLIENEQEKLCHRYNITKEEIKEKLSQNQPENVNIYDVLLEIGKKRGCLASGGRVDEEKISKILIDEFKSGKIGRITLEKIMI